jgi:hypothetical protein
MVFRILKNIVKVTALLTVGAGIGIWFAPPSAKTLMKQRLTVAQKHSKGLQSSADKYWTSNLKQKLASATKSLDPRRIDRKVVDGWLTSGKHTLATISADAKGTQETLVKANRAIEAAKKEYRNVSTILGM